MTGPSVEFAIMGLMQRALAILSVTMVTAGVVILADAGLTLTWKEPISAIFNQVRQNEAGDQLSALENSFAGELADDEGNELQIGPRERVRALASRFSNRLGKLEGMGIGRISIESAGVKQVMVEGTDQTALQNGPGRYPETGLPGGGRTIGIAGHRTTYGAPFRDIDKIATGDVVSVEMPYGTLEYVTTATRIVEPTDTQIVRDIGTERVVLTACHPLYSAEKRYAVFAELESVKPTRPALAR